jgi:RES domain-containing protein
VSIEADIPDVVKIATWTVEDLPANWSAYPPPETLAMRGTEWAESGSAAVLAVPSAVVPDETNFLINPRHPEFRRIMIRTPGPFRLDPRLLKK